MELPGLPEGLKALRWGGIIGANLDCKQYIMLEGHNLRLTTSHLQVGLVVELLDGYVAAFNPPEDRWLIGKKKLRTFSVVTEDSHQSEMLGRFAEQAGIRITETHGQA